STLPLPPPSTPFPYTTLFRSGRDGQPQPGPAVLARRRAIGLRERLEDRPQLVGRDADAGVGHLEMQSAECRVQNRRVGTVCILRSEEHTSELQSPYDLVCRLL